MTGIGRLHPDWTLAREYPLSPRRLALVHAWTAPGVDGYSVAAKGAPEAIATLLLTRAQAAARLGVPLPTFDHLRWEHGLSAVEQTHAQDGSQCHLYRTDAVDRLTSARPG